jgi:hypothetical protein
MSNLFATGKLSGGRTAFELLGLSYQPTTLEVLRAGAGTAFEGPGSAIQDVAAVELEEELGREGDTGIIQGASDILNSVLFGSLSEDTEEEPGVSISQDEWKGSKFFRPDLEYKEGMTTRAAEIYYNRAVRQEDRDFILQQSSGFTQGAAMFTGGLGGALADAKNVVISTAVAAATPLIVGGITAPAAAPVAAGAGVIAGLSRVGTSLTRLNSAGLATLRASRKARLGAVLGEATISTLPQIASGLQNSELTQEDYTTADAALDFAASVGLSAGLWKAGEAVRSAWRRYATPDAMTEVAQLFAKQIEMGEKIDVQPIIKAHLAEFTPSRIDLPDAEVRQVAPGRWEAQVDNRLFTGKSKAQVEADIAGSLVVDTLQPLRELGYGDQAIQQIQEQVNIKLNTRFDNLEEEIVARSPELGKARKALDNAELAFANATKRQKSVAKRLRDSAAARYTRTEEVVRLRAREAATQNADLLAKRAQEADAKIREIQRQETARLLPDFAKAQLDESLESQAARSVDPQFQEIVNTVVPDVKFDPDAPPPPPIDPDEIASIRRSLEDVPLVDNPKNTEQVVKKALAEVEAMRDIPSAIDKLIKCRAGQ